MLSNPKLVNTLPFYMAIINGILYNLNVKKKATNPDKMEIKYKLVLNGVTWAALDKI